MRRRPTGSDSLVVSSGRPVPRNAGPAIDKHRCEIAIAARGLRPNRHPKDDQAAQQGEAVDLLHHQPASAPAGRRLAIFAIVARLAPVTPCILLHEAPEANMPAIPSLRFVSSGRPL